jgi:hypothetical protein
LLVLEPARQIVGEIGVNLRLDFNGGEVKFLCGRAGLEDVKFTRRPEERRQSSCTWANKKMRIDHPVAESWCRVASFRHAVLSFRGS